MQTTTLPALYTHQLRVTPTLPQACRVLRRHDVHESFAQMLANCDNAADTPTRAIVRVRRLTMPPPAIVALESVR